MAKKIIVPEGMLKAAWVAVSDKMQERVKSIGNPEVTELEVARIAIEAALLWQREHPPVPMRDQSVDCLHSFALDGETRTRGPVNVAQVRCIAMWWIRRMYDAPDPEAIADLLVESQAHIAIDSDTLNNTIIEAYRRGQKSVHTESGG